MKSWKLKQFYLLYSNQAIVLSRVKDIKLYIQLCMYVPVIGLIHKEQRLLEWQHSSNDHRLQTKKNLLELTNQITILFISN